MNFNIEHLKKKVLVCSQVKVQIEDKHTMLLEDLPDISSENSAIYERSVYMN